MARQTTWPIHTLAALFAVLIAPATASAKATCDERGTGPVAGGLSGLPAEPVAGEAYTVTVSTGEKEPNRARPTIMLLECSGDGPEPGAFRDLQATPAGETGEFTAEVRFPSAGRWGMSAFGLRPMYGDLGMHRVVAASAADPGFEAKDPAASAAAVTWPAAIGGVALLGLAAAGAMARRRSQRADRTG
jgi:hypothetical protein